MSTFDVLEAYAAARREILRIRAIEMREHDFGQKQMTILYRLTRSSASMGELAEYTISDKASTSRTVASLEAAGDLKRVSDPDDRRVTLIELTPKGRIKAAHAVKLRKIIAQRVNRSLGKDERATLVELLNKMTNYLEQSRQPESK
jgi:DNA-binding MarR family transcriptional regulator